MGGSLACEFEPTQFTAISPANVRVDCGGSGWAKRVASRSFWLVGDPHYPGGRSVSSLRVEDAAVLTAVKDASRREDAVPFGHP
jgi:hypothetical protein